MPLTTDREAAIEAVRRAALLCRAVQTEARTQREDGSLIKNDRSPVTVADFGAQAAVSMTLRDRRPQDRIVGEENADELRAAAGAALRKRVVRHVQSLDLGEGVTESRVLAAIDDCSDPGGDSGRRWILDPIDGTKGYLRGGQYAIALALSVDGALELAVLGCPSLARQGAKAGNGCLFVAERGQGAQQIAIDDWRGAPSDPKPLSTSPIRNAAEAAFCESVEAAHSAHDRHALIARELGVSRAPVRMDSQCKYGMVARGEAAIYLRLPRDESYREKVWDHAAGWLVVVEAGGRVTDVDGRELDFSLGRTLDGNRGVVATNGPLHDRVLEAIRRTEPRAVSTSSA